MGILRGSSAPSVSADANGVAPSLSCSIREEESALCLDCLVTFNVRNRTCPKCDGEQFWLAARWRKPSTAPFPKAAIPFQRPRERASSRLRCAS